MAEMTREQIYSSLDHTKGASKLTPLLTLFPGLADSLLEGTLDIVSLDTNPYYEALSYVWGSPSVREHIILSEKRLSITENLASALRNLRYESEARVLWVDAICINQADIDERSQQVSNMVFIYQQAHRVLVYVGERTEDSDLALDTTEKLGRVTSTTDNEPQQDKEFDELLADARAVGSLRTEE